MGLTAAIVFGAVGTGLQVYGQVKQGQAARAAAEAEARAAESAAQLLETRANRLGPSAGQAMEGTQAGEALRVGAEQESDFRLQVRQLFGSQRVGFAGQNVALTAGSAREVTDETMRMGELDALRIRTHAKRTSEVYLADAADMREQGRIAREGGAYAIAAGEASASAANLGATASIILVSRHILHIQ